MINTQQLADWLTSAVLMLDARHGYWTRAIAATEIASHAAMRLRATQEGRCDFFVIVPSYSFF